MNIFVSVPLAPKSHREYVMDKDDTYTQSGLHYKRNLGPRGQTSPASSEQASLPYPKSRQLHDSHGMVTLTYLAVYVTSYRNCSVSVDRETSRSSIFSKNV